MEDVDVDLLKRLLGSAYQKPFLLSLSVPTPSSCHLSRLGIVQISSSGYVTCVKTYRMTAIYNAS